MWKSFWKSDWDAARNSWRKLVWKMQKTMGLDARWPVLWSKLEQFAVFDNSSLDFLSKIIVDGCRLKSLPSEQFVRGLDVSRREQLLNIIAEVEVRLPHFFHMEKKYFASC